MTEKMLNNKINQLPKSQILIPTTKLGFDFVKKLEQEKSPDVIEIVHENGNTFNPFHFVFQRFNQ